MKINYAQYVAWLPPLSNLQGKQEPIKTDGKATGTAFEVYAFPAITRVNIVHNIVTLRGLLDKYNDKQKELIKSMSQNGDGKDIDSNPVLSKQYTEALRLMREEKFNVKLAFISWHDLATAGVDPVTCAAFMPLIRDFPKIDDKDVIPDEPEEAPAPSVPKPS